MIITVPDTNATGIHMALVKARHNIGVASSMVFTMIVVADLRHDFVNTVNQPVAVLDEIRMRAGLPPRTT